MLKWYIVSIFWATGAGESYVCYFKENGKVKQSQRIHFATYTKFFIVKFYVQTLLNILLILI